MTRVAIVHDALCVAGGAERLVLWMAKAFPSAPIYTSVYLPDQTFPEFRELEVHSLALAKLVNTERQFKLLFPFWLMELQKLNFDSYDYILSSSTYLAKYIRPSKKVLHRAFIHAPFRLLWRTESYSRESLPTPRLLYPLINASLPRLRRWDQEETRKIPRIATSCQNIANEIKQIYGLPAQVIYPPVKINRHLIRLQTQEDYFISVSRLISHKRVDLAVEACTRLKKRLIIVGDGPERSNLEKMAGETIQFVGSVNDEKLDTLYINATALIFTSHEDFGIVPLEAQASGIPVIAYGKGGVLETVKDGVTGLFYPNQTVESLIESVIHFNNIQFDQSRIIDWVSKFDERTFISGIQDFVLS